MSVGTEMLHPSQLAILPATKDRGLNNFVGWVEERNPTIKRGVGWSEA
ncbi:MULTISPECIES: hypothetical protein [unclassified Microcoleus]